MISGIRLVDLSLEIKEGLGGIPDDSPIVQALGAKIHYTSHQESVPQMLRSFPGISADDLPSGLGWTEEQITLNTHTGTHMDSPWHYSPTSEGKKSKTIDEVPLEYCFSNGVVLDMTHKKPGEVITAADVREALVKIDYKLKPLDIVLIRTDTDKLWDTVHYWTNQPGMGREATIWLVDQGVKVVGIDAAGWDRPFGYQAAEFKKTGDKSLIWEGHFAGIEREYFQMEKLANLDQLPPSGFKVSCFPIKIFKAGAAWVRPVAIISN